MAEKSDDWAVWGRGSAKNEQVELKAMIVGLDNGVLVLVSDQTRYGIGTITMSTPPSDITDRALSTPYAMFGLKNATLANSLAKVVSQKLKMLALSSVFIKTHEVKPEIVAKLAMQATMGAVEEASKRR